MGSNGTKARGASRAPGRNCGLSSEMGALWDFLQMNLKATGLPCRSATLAAMLGNRLQWLGIQAERPQEALHHQGEPWGEAITVALKKGLDLEFILKMETRGFPDRLCAQGWSQAPFALSGTGRAAFLLQGPWTARTWRANTCFQARGLPQRTSEGPARQ